MFKRKQQSAIAPDRFGYLGKLPLQAEFIKHGISQAVGQRLDAWVQTSVANLKSQTCDYDEQAFMSMPPYAFMVYTPEFRLSIGVLIASRDSSGRSYPFICYRTLNNPIAYEFQSVVPFLFSDYFHQVTNSLLLKWEGKSLQEFAQSIEALSAKQVTVSRREALEMSVAELYQQTADEGYLKKVQQAAAQLAAAKTENLSEKCFKTALPTNNHTSYVMFWLQLIGNYYNFSSSGWSVFWTHGNGFIPANLQFVNQFLAKEQFSNLLSGECQFDLPEAMSNTTMSFMQLLQQAAVKEKAVCS